VAHHNAASARVLARAGFVEVGSETAYAPGLGAEIVEHTYRLDHSMIDSHIAGSPEGDARLRECAGTYSEVVARARGHSRSTVAWCR
jgi:hypothetical protein